MKRSFIILLHLGYWVLYLLLILLFLLFMEAGGVKTINQQQLIGFFKVMTAFTIFPALISFYSFYLLLFNKYLSEKKITALCLTGLVTVLIAGLCGLAGMNLVTNGKIFRNNGLKEMLIMMAFLSILALIHGIIALVMKGFITWYGDIRIKAALKQKNFETELALVRSQLSPHFLFNTINNIDVLIEKDAVKASAYLNKLSDIMRFMLYETKTENIPLQKELSYIDKYIDLQKIRTANVNFVQYSTVGETGKWVIAPMLFIPFIENAFKHSGNKKEGHAIVVNIKATGKSLEFYCENHFSENHLADHKAGGIGNDLIQKRLGLLYPGKHELNIEKEKDTYKVHLIIYKNEN
ncbi:MAG: histidine kinase [Ferruginibacter sp.]